MVSKTAYGSTRRFGVRYGTKVKAGVGKIEALAQQSKSCPFCRKEKAKKIAAGIWLCKKCNKKFAGGAYTVGQLKLKEEAQEEGDKKKTEKKKVGEEKE